MITVAQLDGSDETVYLTSGVHYTSGADTYLPLLDGSFVFTQTLYGEYSLEPQASIGAGEVTAVNLDSIDHLYDQGYDGREVRLWRVEDENATLPPVPTLVLQMTVPEPSWNSIKFGMESPLQVLDHPLQEAVFEPVSGEQYDNIDFVPAEYVDGDPTLEGDHKPMLYGRCNNAPLFLLNRYMLLYACNYDRAGEFRAVHQFWSVMSGGIRYEFQTGGNYPDVASLMGATVQPGRYICCLDAGLVRLGTPPAGTVTADVSSAPDGACRVGDLVLQILADFDLGITQDAAAQELTLLNQVCPLPAGIYVTSDASVYDVVTNLLASMNAWISHDGNSRFMFGYLPFHDEVSLEGGFVFDADYRLEGTEEFQAFGAEDGIPASKLTWEYSRNWSPLTDGDVGVTVSADRKSYLTSNYLSVVTESPAEVLDRHLLAKPAEVQTLLVGNCPIQLDNDGFDAGLIRWEPGNAGELDPGTIDILPIGEGVRLDNTAYVTQRIYLPQAVTGRFVLTVVGQTTGAGGRISYWNGSAWQDTDVTWPVSGTASIPMNLSDPLTQVAVRMQALAGASFTLRSAQISDPTLTALAQAEAERRSEQAAARGQCLQFVTPLDYGVHIPVGATIRIRDYRYGLDAAPSFQVISKVQDWEGETVTLRAARLIR